MRKLVINLFSLALLTVGSCGPCRHCDAADKCGCATTGVCTCPAGQCQCPRCPNGVLLAQADAKPKITDKAPPAPQPGPAPTPAPTPANEQIATVVVTGCFGSILSVDGYTVQQIGNVRTIVTPPIGKESHYTITATGFERTITGVVTLWPGSTTAVTLDWTKDTLTFSKQATVAYQPVYQPVYYYQSFGGCSGGGCSGGGCAGGSCGRR